MSKSIPALILASSSLYRQQLLQRLQIEFEAISPDIDESPLSGENAVELVCRLARNKAGKIIESHPQAIVIGSDQVLAFEGEIMSKPGTRARALDQLEKVSGKRVVFHTGLSVYNPKSHDYSTVCVDTTVTFRTLKLAEIERYLDQEEVLNCAGSFKSEALGISLTERIESTDPTALIGLPLISLSHQLREIGLELP